MENEFIENELNGSLLNDRENCLCKMLNKCCCRPGCTGPTGPTALG